jgi:hypothetical protein
MPSSGPKSTPQKGRVRHLVGCLTTTLHLEQDSARMIATNKIHLPLLRMLSKPGITCTVMDLMRRSGRQKATAIRGILIPIDGSLRHR